MVRSADARFAPAKRARLLITQPLYVNSAQRSLVFVGNGVNDALALTAAVAIAGGVMTSGGLGSLVANAGRLARFRSC